MKKMSALFLFIAVLAAAGLVLYGCGGIASTVSTAAGSGSLTMTAATTTAVARGINLAKTDAPKVPGSTLDASYGHCNPWYKDKLQTPSSYIVGLVECKLLTQNNYDDPNAYTINLGKVNGLDVSVTNPYEVDMATGSCTIASNANPPQPAVYTHIGTRIVYLEQWLYGCFSTTSSSDLSIGKFRVCTATTGNVQAGDILFYNDSVWNWINPTTGSLTPITSARPGGTASGWDYPNNGLWITAEGTIAAGVQVVQDSFWSLRTTGNNLLWWQLAEAQTLANTGYVFRDIRQLAANVTVEAGKSYIGTMLFNIAQNNDGYFTGANAIVPTETGTFFWDDVTNDATFKPFLPFASGGDWGGDGVHGQGQFFPLPPTITVSMIGI